MSQHKKPDEWKWWLIWVITFLGSLLSPAVYHWRDVDEIIEPLRFASLLPPILVLFRDLAELSCWIPLILFVLFIFAARHKEAMRSLICWGTFITAVCSSLSAGYFLLIASAYIVQYIEVREEVSELRGKLISEEDPETAPPAESTTPRSANP